MKTIIVALLLLIHFCTFSQKAAPNTFTVSKAGIAKYETLTELIPSLPSYSKVIHYEITSKNRDKAMISAGGNEFSIETLKYFLKGADLKSKVFLDLKLQQHDSKISACSYKFYIIE